MTLSVSDLRRLWALTYPHRPLTQAEEDELRELVRREGCPDATMAKPLDSVTQAGKGILMAYYLVDHVDFMAEAAQA